MTRHSADEFVSSDVTGMDVIVPESERAAPDGGHSAPATTNSVRRRRGRPKTSAEQRAAKEAAVAEKKAAHKAAATKEKLRREAEKAGLTLIEGTEEISEILRLGDLRITEYAPRTLEPHPLCSMLPLMTNEELYEFIEDIRRHGQREPGTTLDGKILDGRSRDLACEWVGIPFRARPYDGDDPLGFVISANIHRRHMTVEQRREFRENLIKLHPEMSDRFLAGLARVDKNTIAADRARLERRGESSPRETRTDSKGRRRRARKRTAPVEEPPSIPPVMYVPATLPSAWTGAAEKGTAAPPSAEPTRSDQPAGPAAEPLSQAMPTTLAGDHWLRIPRDPQSVAKLVHQQWREDEVLRLIAELRYFPGSSDESTTTEGDQTNTNAASFSVDYGALAKMSPERQAAAFTAVESGHGSNVRAITGFRSGNEGTEAATQKEPTPYPPTAKPVVNPTVAQKWVRYLRSQMSVPELRDLRDAIDEILAAVDHSGSLATH